MHCLLGFVFPGVGGKTAQTALYGGGAPLTPCGQPWAHSAHCCPRLGSCQGDRGHSGCTLFDAFWHRFFDGGVTVARVLRVAVASAPLGCLAARLARIVPVRAWHAPGLRVCILSSHDDNQPPCPRWLCDGRRASACVRPACHVGGLSCRRRSGGRALVRAHACPAKGVCMGVGSWVPWNHADDCLATASLLAQAACLVVPWRHSLPLPSRRAALLQRACQAELELAGSGVPHFGCPLGFSYALAQCKAHRGCPRSVAMIAWRRHHAWAGC